MDDFRFNRRARGGRHQYLNDFAGMRQFGSDVYDGYIKCKLVHRARGSLVYPDQIYVTFNKEERWIQPLYFTANVISWHNGHGTCDLSVDISHGVCLQIRFTNDALVRRLPDGSLLYRCRITGPKYLYRYTTGPAKINHGTPAIKLYHHTTREALEGIVADNSFRTSRWNIQGTKKSTNITYLYLTPLTKIACIDDLTEIAMSSDGYLRFRLDSNFSDAPDLALRVYRESTLNRTHTWGGWIRSHYLATQPCYKHTGPDGYVYFAIVCPFVHRIGSEVDERVSILGNNLAPSHPKALRYAVIGDARTIKGLEAPYDEEATNDILKVEEIGDGEDLISFWMRNRNSDQFNNKVVATVEFG